MSEPKAGPCLWCGEYVTDQRLESGCKTADWATSDGDFGCGMSPDTTSPDDEDGGTGGHTRQKEGNKMSEQQDRPDQDTNDQLVDYAASLLADYHPEVSNALCDLGVELRKPLIAAAPEMCDFLTRIRDSGKDPIYSHIAETILAKIKGE